MAYPGHSADDLQEDEDEARAWIEAVTHLEKPADESFEAWLRSGVVLCTLLNALKPNSIKKISTSTMPFKQMEQISLFLRGTISASRGAAAPSRHRRDSCPSHHEVGGFFLDFEADAPRRHPDIRSAGVRGLRHE